MARQPATNFHVTLAIFTKGKSTDCPSWEKIPFEESTKVMTSRLLLNCVGEVNMFLCIRFLFRNRPKYVGKSRFPCMFCIEDDPIETDISCISRGNCFFHLHGSQRGGKHVALTRTDCCWYFFY